MKIIAGILIAFFIAFAGLILFDFYGIPYMVTRELRSIQCDGIIISMEEIRPCFLTIEVKQKIDTAKFDVGHCCGDDSFFEFAAIGDGIKKESGHMTLIITKNAAGLKKEFDYPFCFQ